MAPRAAKGAVVIVDLGGKPTSGGMVMMVGAEMLARRYYPMPDGQVQFTADADPNWRFTVSASKVPAIHPIIWSGQKV